MRSLGRGSGGGGRRRGRGGARAPACAAMGEGEEHQDSEGAEASGAATVADVWAGDVQLATGVLARSVRSGINGPEPLIACAVARVVGARRQARTTKRDLRQPWAGIPNPADPDSGLSLCLSARTRVKSKPNEYLQTSLKN